MQAILSGFRKIRKTERFLWFNFMFLTVLGAAMFIPILFTVNQAFKPIEELFLLPPTFFAHHPTWFNFKSLLLSDSLIPFSRYVTNTVLVTAANVFGVIMISAMAAYAFSKRVFPGGRLLFSFIIVSLMFDPGQVLIPRYLVVANTGIMDTYLAHILPFLPMPVCVFLMKQFVDQIPNALMDAAKIDGAKEWVLFTKIVIPMCMPAIATVGILTFQTVWPETESSRLFTQIESQRLLNFYVSSLVNGSGTTSASVGSVNSVAGTGIQAASALIVFVPFVIVFLAFQRKVLQTMANSGIK